MTRNYNFNHRLIACILLINLFLQSCGNSFNQLTPQEKKSTRKDIDIKPLVGKELTAEGGNLVIFYEQYGRLQADIRVDEKQPTSNYERLSVAIEEGTDLAELPLLHSKIQQRRIQFKPTQNGNPGHISILKKGRVLGGMKRNVINKGDEEQEGKGKEKEKEKEGERSANNHLEYRDDLLEHARNGEDKAQFELAQECEVISESTSIPELKNIYLIKSIKWYKKAAKQNYPQAQEKLINLRDRDLYSNFNTKVIRCYEQAIKAAGRDFNEFITDANATKGCMKLSDLIVMNLDPRKVPAKIEWGADKKHQLTPYIFKPLFKIANTLEYEDEIMAIDPSKHGKHRKKMKQLIV